MRFDRASTDSPKPKRAGEFPLIGPFKYLLAQAMIRQGITATEFSRRLDHSSNGLVSLVLRGHKKAPLENIHDWLAVLDLSDEEYGSLYLAALRDYAPSYVFDIINTSEGMLRDAAEIVTAMAKERGRELPPMPTLFGSIGRLHRRGMPPPETSH